MQNQSSDGCKRRRAFLLEHVLKCSKDVSIGASDAVAGASSVVGAKQRPTKPGKTNAQKPANSKNSAVVP